METIQLKDINLLEIGHNIQISGVIWSGPNIAFTTQFPGKNEDYSNLKKLIMNLNEWHQLLKQTDLLETEIIMKNEVGNLIKAIVRKTQRQIDSYTQWNVFKRDNYTCRYCGRNGIPLTVDHIDLWEDGGASIPENLLSACRRCNKDRGKMKYEEWLKSPIYTKLSTNLPQRIKDENLAIVKLLPELYKKRVYNIRSR